MFDDSNLEEILERARILLEEDLGIKAIAKELEIKYHYLPTFYFLFKEKYGLDPLAYKQEFKLKTKDFINELADKMKVLNDEDVKIITCEIKFGDYKALTIISKDRKMYDELVNQMLKKNLLSKPGTIINNSLIFGLYQILEVEDDKNKLISYKSILKDLDGAYKSIKPIKKIVISSIEPFLVSLNRHLDYFVRAYEMMINNNA